MSVNIGTVIGYLKLEDSFSGVLETAAGNLATFENRLSKSADRLKSLGTTLTASITLPLVGIGVAATKTFSDFDKSMNLVRAVIEPTADEMRALEATAIEMGAKTVFSAGQAADALGELGKAGFTSKQAIEALPSVLQLAASANIGLADAASLTANTMSTFGLQTKDLARVNDILTKAANASTIDITDLRESLKYVGPVAKSAGVGLAETTAAIALMGSAGIKGSMAGTALRNIMTELLNPANKTKKIMGELGIESFMAGGKMMHLADVVQVLHDRGATTAQVMEMFGDRAGPAMAALIEKGSASLKDLNQQLDNSAGIAQRTADTMMSGINGALEQLKGSVETASIAIGRVLAPAVSQVANLLGDAADTLTTVIVPAFERLPTPIKVAAGSLVLFVAAWGPIAFAVGAAGKVLASMSGSIAFVIGLLPKWTKESATAAIAQTGLAGATTMATEAIAAKSSALKFAAGEQLGFNFGIIQARDEMGKFTPRIWQAEQALLPLSGTLESTGIAAATAATETTKVATSSTLFARAIAFLGGPLTATIGLIVAITASVRALTGSWTTTFGLLFPPIGGLMRAVQDLRGEFTPLLRIADDLAHIVQSGLVVAWQAMLSSNAPLLADIRSLATGMSVFARIVRSEALDTLRELRDELKVNLPGGFREAVAVLEWARNQIPSFGKAVHDVRTTLDDMAGAGKDMGPKFRVGFAPLLNLAPELESNSARVGALTGETLRKAQAYVKSLNDAYAGLSHMVRTDLVAAYRAGMHDISALQKDIAPDVPKEVIQRVIDSYKDITQAAKQHAEELKKLTDTLFGADIVKRAADYVHALGGSTAALSHLTKEAQQDVAEAANKALEVLRLTGRGASDAAIELQKFAKLTSSRVGENAFGGAMFAIRELTGAMPSFIGNMGEGMRAFLGFSKTVNDSRTPLAHAETDVAAMSSVLGVSALAAIRFGQAFGQGTRQVTEARRDVSLMASVFGLASSTFIEAAARYAAFTAAVDKGSPPLQLAGRRVVDLSVQMAAIPFAPVSQHVKENLRLNVDWRQSLQNISGAFAELAQVANGSLGTVLRTLGTVASSASLGAQSFKGIKDGMNALKGPSKNLLGGIASLTAGILGAVSAAISLGKALIDAFTKSDAEKAADEIARTWGVSISSSLAESIEKTMKSKFAGMKNNRWLAEIFNLGAITEEVGLTADNISSLVGQLRQAFVFLDEGSLKVADVQKVLNDTFSKFASYYTDRNALISTQLQEIIKLDDQLGVHSKAVADFLDAQAQKIAGGFNKIASGFLQLTTGFREGSDDMKLLRESIDAVSESTSKLSHEAPEAHRGVVELAEASKGLKTGGFAPEFLDGVQKGLHNIGILAGAAFGALLANGASAVEALQSMKPGLDEIAKILKATGLEADGTLGSMLRWRDIVENNKGIFDSLSGVDDMLVGLHNSGLLNQEMFSSLSTTITQAFEQLLTQGTAGADAIALMQPQLQRVWELQQDFGYSVDAATQKLLTQAEEAGAVGEAHRSAQDRMVDAMERTAFAVEGLAELFGVVLPAKAQAGADGVNEALNGIKPPDIDLKVRVHYDDPGFRPQPPDTYSGGQGYRPPGYQHGGVVYAASGMFVPRGTDTVPAMLTPGEGVLNTSAMSVLGKSGLDALNSGQAAAAIKDLVQKIKAVFAVDLQAAIDSGTERGSAQIAEFVKSVMVTLDKLSNASVAGELLPNDDRQKLEANIDQIRQALVGLPDAKEFTLETDARSVADAATAIDTLPDLKPFEVLASALGLDPIAADIQAIPAQKLLQVLAQATGVREVKADVDGIPSEKLLQVLAESRGVNEVVAQIRTIPSDKQVRASVNAFGVDDTIAAIGTIPGEHRTDVNVDAFGIEDVVAELATIPSEQFVAITLPDVGEIQARAREIVDAILAELARIPSQVSIGINQPGVPSPAPSPAPPPVSPYRIPIPTPPIVEQPPQWRVSIPTPGFATGTGGRFEDFGRVKDVQLHGREAVTREDQKVTTAQKWLNEAGAGSGGSKVYPAVFYGKPSLGDIDSFVEMLAASDHDIAANKAHVRSKLRDALGV